MIVSHSEKSCAIEESISRIHDGSTVMIGGFGIPGTPFELIKELVRQGPKNLTIIKNDSNEAGMGVDWLLNAGMVKKLITSHIGLNPNAVRMMNEKLIEVEFLPQGILAERIRTAGAGLIGFLTDIGMGTPLGDDKETVNLQGSAYIFEPALNADFALIHAFAADSRGNLTYAAAARNFNPLMAMAAKFVIAEAEVIVEVGEIHPNEVHTASAFVDRVVVMEHLPEVYKVVQQ